MTAPRPPEPEPAPGQPYPACPLCGGGPLVVTMLGLACKSCARVITRTRP